MELLYIIIGIFLFSWLLDIFDNNKKLKHQHIQRQVQAQGGNKGEIKKASAYGAAAYAIYHFADEAPEETWTVSFFVLTWQYIGGILGFVIAIPITIIMFLFRAILGRNKYKK